MKRGALAAGNVSKHAQLCTPLPTWLQKPRKYLMLQSMSVECQFLNGGGQYGQCCPAETAARRRPDHQLCREVVLDASKLELGAPSQRLRSLLAWLVAGNARNVRRIHLTYCRAPSDTELGQQLLSSCLGACGAGGALATLRVEWQDEQPEHGSRLNAGWLVLLDHLEELSLTAGGELYFDSSLGGLSRLQRLRLDAGTVTIAAGVQFPPALESLMYCSTINGPLPQASLLLCQRATKESSSATSTDPSFQNAAGDLQQAAQPQP